MAKTSTTRIISWNVNGIRAVAKKGNFTEVFDEETDIVCIQETKAHPDQLPALIRHPPGYFSSFAWAERKGYSGVVTYSRKEPLSEGPGFATGRFDGEGRVMVTGHPGFYLCNIYFPNGKASKERLQYKLDFYEECLDYVTALVEDGNNVVICGDVNTAHTDLDLTRPKENEKISGFLPVEREWIDRLIAAGFIDTFRMFEAEGGHYSWWDLKTRARERNVGWRIDYFFVNEGLAEKVAASYMMTDVYGSDHCPIVLELEE
ncbi:exodeoxyribonuclease III [Methanomicrobiaceae archaeon CYW5]|uniref:exodeoxyribonuclease III n=1 Tax=Methanovulcanius yangii TaxID=1789227 RepID=UPI0029CA29AF|nr:exodeoxyribonuclease III [Methanovulcanius yangii]MBT8507653.1 exodeoxyribonuclease III [Methanovulcanius yangii]